MKATSIAAPRVFLLLLGAGLVGCAASTNDPAPPQTTANLQARPSETPPIAAGRGAVDTLDANAGDRVFFAYDSSLLNPESEQILRRQAGWLRSHPAVVATIQGHSDERGTREYNLALGDRRATAVRDYLVSQGVPAERLHTISYGKERPQIDGHDETSWAQNRRAVSVAQ